MELGDSTQLHLDSVSRTRQALKLPGAVAVEFVFLAFVGSIFGLILIFAGRVSAPYEAHVDISLSLWALPQYTLLSLCRGLAAYLLSLIFTLVYGTFAAHNPRAERIMLPVLDVLQAIPVLGFLPGLVLAMIALFPTRQIGLELACVVMIFTAQAWNMTFSFHGSLRSIPKALREVAMLQNLSPWRVFTVLEVPAAMIGLVWNSMMSMAGGWFFLTVNEAFTLGEHDYRLPGIGSYMNEAIQQGNVKAICSAVVAMVLMIVLVDQILWRPLVVWSQRFKLEDQADAEPPHSWMLDLLRHSRILDFIRIRTKPQRKMISMLLRKSTEPAAATPGISVGDAVSRFMKFILGAALIVGALVGARALFHLLAALPLVSPDHTDDWVSVLLAFVASLLRTTAAVVLGALWTLPAGVLIGLSPKWSERLQPIIQVIASFPAPMLFPLLTMLLVLLHIPFGFGCVALMLLGAQWYILFNVIAGAVAIPSELKEAAAVYGLGTKRVWLDLYIPAVFPYLLTGLVTAAGGAWNATIVSEYVELKHERFIAFGLGSLISDATARGNFPLLAATVCTMAAAVVLINRFLWKRLISLAENRFSMNL